MTRRNRSGATVALVAAASLTFGACGSGDSGDSSGSSGDVNLRFTFWGGDNRQSSTQEIVDNFEDENPGITVDLEISGWGGYWDKLATQVAADDAPDVIQMDEKYIREYADRGALLDLQDVDTSAMTESTVATGVMDGGQFGIPTGINALTLVANPEVFDEAGVAIPDDTTWTWDDYAAVAQEISQNSEAHGSAKPQEPTNLQLWLRQQGKELTDDEGQLALEVGDAEEYLGMLKDWMDDGVLPEASIMSEVHGASLEQSLVGMGDAGIGPMWTNTVSPASAAAGVELQPLRLPSTDGSEGGANLFYKSSRFMAANGNTEHPEEAQMFIDYMVNSEEAGLINMSDRGLPANLEVREAVVPELDEADTRAAEYLNDIEDELGPDMPILPLGFSALQDIIVRYEMETFFEDMTPAEAAEQMVSEMEASVG